MKYVFLIFALLVAGISADAVQSEVPVEKNMERFVDGIVNQIVANVTQTIIDEGLDPLHINREARQWGLSVPELGTVIGILEDLFIVNLSDIRILQLNFSLITLRVNYHFCIPHIYVSVGYAHGILKGFGEQVDATIRGRVDIYDACAQGGIRVLLGVSEITIRELDIHVSVRDIDSKVEQVDVYKFDLTDRINNLIGTVIQGWLDDYGIYIDTFLEIVLWDPIERALNQDWD